ncbi:MAG: hypothetical protein WAV56_03815 [Microgenomates group bacterium]
MERLRRTKKGVERLRQAVVVKKQLEEINNGVEAIPSFGGMDLAFVNETRDLMGVSLFGEREVVGVVVEKAREDLETRLRRMGKTDDMDDLLAQGARVIGLTEGDLDRWLRYYEQAADYLPVLGHSAWEQSGLRKYKREETIRLGESLRLLVKENRSFLHEVGAVGLRVVVGGDRGEYFFEDKKNQVAPVQLRNVRVPAMGGSMLGEIVRTRVEVVGIVLPKQGENKLELYIRTHRLGKKYSDKLGREVVFAAGTEGQIKLWQGLGMRPEVAIPGLVSEEELLGLLIFGESNLSPGLLRRSDSIGDGRWALLDQDVMQGVITFVGKMEQDGRRIRRLPPVQVFDPRARKNGEFKTMPMNGAVAIMRVAEEMDFEEMKKLAKPIEDRFAHIMNAVGRQSRPRLIFLTPSLFEHWCKKGGFWATTEQVRWMDVARWREYGFGDPQKLSGNVEGTFYSAAYTGPKIGGGFRTLFRRSKEGDSLVLLDTSTQFGKEKRPDRRRYADALIAGIAEGDIPKWPHTIEPEALLHSAKIVDQKIEKAGSDKDSLVVYLATEIVANMSEDEVVGVLGERIGKIVWEIGGNNLGLFGDPKAKVIYPVSHIHVDHIKLTQNLRADIPLLMSLASKVMAQARDDLNPVSAEILTHPEWYNGQRGKATPRKDRNVVVLRNGQEYTKDGIRIELGSVEHSTIGAVARRIEFPDGLVVVDTGDFRRWGRSVEAESKTQRTVEKWAGEKLDWLILETTAIREGADLNTRGWKQRLEKVPVITDEPLFDGVSEILNDPENAGKTVAIFSSPYDLSRNATLMRAVAESGREGVLGVRHAMIAARYETEQNLLGPQARLYDDFDLMIPPYGLYLTEGSKVYTATTALQTELAKRGTSIYDRSNILFGSKGRVLFFNPFSTEISSLDNLPLEGRLAVIWSNSIMYSNADVLNFEKNKAHYIKKYTQEMWAEPNFWSGNLPLKLRHPKKGILHRSGHSSPLELLWFLNHFADKKLKILLHHTEKVGVAAKFIKGAFPRADWEIVDSLAHYGEKTTTTPERRWMGPLLRLDK